MKLTRETKYYTISLETANRLLLSAIDLIKETYEEELHEYNALTPFVRTATAVGKDLYDEIEFLESLVVSLKENRTALTQILPRKIAAREG